MLTATIMESSASARSSLSLAFSCLSPVFRSSRRWSSSLAFTDFDNMSTCRQDSRRRGTRVNGPPLARKESPPAATALSFTKSGVFPWPALGQSLSRPPAPTPRYCNSFCVQALPLCTRPATASTWLAAASAGIGHCPTNASNRARRRSRSFRSRDGPEGDGEEGVEANEGGSGVGFGGDIGLAALMDELVWNGDDDDEDEVEGEQLHAGQHVEGSGGDGEEWGEDEIDVEWRPDLSGEFAFITDALMADGGEDPEIKKELARDWGSIRVVNDQDEYEIDTAVVEVQVRRAMEVLGCQAWDVGVTLTTDEEVHELNARYRGMDKPTDILSFPMKDLSKNPAVLPKVRHPTEMDLGDMFVSLAYVDRQIARDREELESRDIEEREGDDDGVLQALPTGERGVSGAMADAFDLQERVSLLIVHGLIHLLGYDHETDEDFEAMVAVEERVLEAIRPTT